MSTEILVFIDTFYPIKTKRNDIILSIMPKPHEYVLFNFDNTIREDTESFKKGDYIQELPQGNIVINISENSIDLTGNIKSSGLRRKVDSTSDTDTCYSSMFINKNHAIIRIKQIGKETEQILVMHNKLLQALHDAIEFANPTTYTIQKAVISNKKICWKDIDSDRNLFKIKLKMKDLNQEESYRLISHKQDGTIIHHGWE